MKIGIMGAMPEEVDIIREQMKDISEVEHGGRKYYLGKLNNTDVVLVFSRWGKVASATTATSLITEFKINQLIFTGVAGAVSPNLKIGDIVIGEQFYQHDMDARPLFEKHVIPLTGMTFFKADAALIKRAESACNNLLKSPIEHIGVGGGALKEFGITKPKCVVGSIASGDQFIADSKKTEAILYDQPKTAAVEMEGAAVAQVCHDYKIPFVVIRTISDVANHSAHIDFPKFIDQIAKHYSENIIKNMFSKSFLINSDNEKIIRKERESAAQEVDNTPLKCKL